LIAVISRIRVAALSLAGSLALALLLLFAPAAALESGMAALVVKAGSLPDMTLGSAKAPITIVEYSSLTCSHCAAFAENVFPMLQSKYIDTGKVRFVFREFPLDELAAAAAMLARCIDKTNGEKAMAVIEVLFASQEKWAVRNPLPQLQQITKQAGMSQQAFDECLKDQTLYNNILAMRERASKEYKVESTPTLFVNGKMIKGGVAIEELAKAIDPLLPKS